MRRKIAIASAALTALGIFLLPAILTEQVRERVPSRTYTNAPHTARLTIPTEDPWVVDTHPYRGLVEPRKDRP
jgi:hypothetical protein